MVLLSMWLLALVGCGALVVWLLRDDRPQWELAVDCLACFAIASVVICGIVILAKGVTFDGLSASRLWPLYSWRY